MGVARATDLAAFEEVEPMLVTTGQVGAEKMNWVVSITSTERFFSSSQL